MTLLPIIYTSLLIFSAFFFFVIVVSYITYKTKSRKAVPVYLRHHETLVNQLGIQSAGAVNFRSVQPVQIKEQHVNPVKQVKTERKNEFYPKPFESTKRRDEQTINYNNEYAREINRSESRRTKRNSSTQILPARLEIMNNSDRFKTRVQDFSYPAKSSVSYTNHGDINLFSFYSDRTDMDFVALSAPNVSRAI